MFGYQRIPISTLDIFYTQTGFSVVFSELSIWGSTVSTVMEQLNDAAAVKFLYLNDSMATLLHLYTI